MAHICKCKTCGHEIDVARPSLERRTALMFKYVELAKIVDRIALAAGDRTRLGELRPSETLAFAIADADYFLKREPQEPLLTDAEEAEALSYMDSGTPTIPVQTS